METITSFLTTTPVFIFLVPVILILVVLLVVINKHNKVEVVAPISVPPVTTTPAPAQATEVVTQAIPSIVQPTPPSMPVQSAEVVIEHNVVTTPTVKPVVVEEIIPEVVAEVVPAPTTETPTPVIAWRPVEPIAVAEEEVPFVSNVQTEISTGVEQNVTEVTSDFKPSPESFDSPVVAEDIYSQSITTEVVEAAPVIQEETTAIMEEVVPPPPAHPTM